MSFPLPLKSGTVVGGHYIVDGLINRGGFGSVYRGIDTSEGDRPCAIKETYDVTPAARRQALMEAGILFTVRSKHLPQVYDAFEEGGRFYLVMQLIEGQNLLQLVQARGTPCREAEVLAWILPIMQVLEELHRRNPAVIHRDIKPANIILTVDGNTVLVDFGVTKLYDPDGTSQTMIKAITEGFSPLEQYTGTTTPQSDIYSLAATMYYLLTATTPPSAISRSLRDTLKPPRALNPHISARTEQALLRGLAINLDQRYRSMREFTLALQGQAGGAAADPTVRVLGGSRRTPQPSWQASQPRPLPGAWSGPAGPVSSGPVSYAGYVVLSPPLSTPPKSSLPSPLGQGCLYGMLQGILAALIVLLLRTQGSFSLAIVVGWLFYLLAGFMTTRKGGGSLRGAWAGLWAGIAGTITFWMVFLSGALILIAQRLQADALNSGQTSPSIASSRAFIRTLHAIAPWLPSTQTTNATSSGVLLFVAAGLILALLLGWMGGLLGRRRALNAARFSQAPGRP